MSQIKTVWVEHDSEGGTPSFSIHPSGEEDAEQDALFVTNDPAAFDGFFTCGGGAAVDIFELCRLLGLARVDQKFDQLLPGDVTAEQGFRQLWIRLDSRFAALPLWVFELVQSIYAGLGEIAMSRFFKYCAERARADGTADTEVWSGCFKIRNGYQQKVHPPRHDECEALEIDQLAAYLETGGTYQQRVAGYEERPGQVSMLRQVAEAFNRRSHLVIEAGTGVGKSIAYLLPAAAWARLNGSPVIISTNTRNLQSQLIDKELPLIKEIVDSISAGDRRPLRATLLKGRNNYLCLRQLGTLIDFSMFELERPEMRHLITALFWALRTDDGDLDNFAGSGHADSAFLSHLYSSGEECGGRGCRYYKRCFMQQARQRAMSSDIIVVNHALVFAEASSGGNILPPCGQIIFDEAHNLEESATRHLCVELSLFRLMAALKRVTRGRAGHRGGVIEVLGRHIENGALTRDKEVRHNLTEKIAAVRMLVEQIRRSALRFFEIGAVLLENCDGATRMRSIVDLDKEVQSTNAFGANTPLHRFKRQIFKNGAFVSCPASHDEELLRYSKDALKQQLAETATHLQEMAIKLRQAMEGELAMYGDQAQGLESCAVRLREFAADLDFVTAATETEYVFWVEPAGRDRRRVSMFGAPLSIAGTLNETLYKTRDTCVFCSATLRVSGSFAYINRRLGFDLIESERFMEKVAPSPFDYIRQCVVYAPQFMPEPTGTGSLSCYIDTLSSMMLDLFVATGGRALALFTSYDMMNRVAGLIEEPLREQGITLLVHGKSGTRDQLTRIFRAGERCALLGTHSFWEGVDVIGEALSCVVVARLPFAAVGDPIVEARCEQIQIAGGNAFREFSLPQAVIRFRQGFGRLIRTGNDRGVVVVADPRIVTKRYGSSFVKSLPCPVLKVRSPEELMCKAGDFFAGSTSTMWKKAEL